MEAARDVIRAAVTDGDAAPDPATDPMGADGDLYIEDYRVPRSLDPGLVPDAIELARRTYRKIRQGLFWAFAYNVVGIPLAALGYLSPILAGGAMAFSSVSVVLNALSLRWWRPSHLPGHDRTP